jgi:hypothetical protein
LVQAQVCAFGESVEDFLVSDAAGFNKNRNENECVPRPLGLSVRVQTIATSDSCQTHPAVSLETVKPGAL